MAKITVSSWEFDGYYNNTKEIDRKFEEVEEISAKNNYSKPELEHNVHSCGERYSIQADERVLNHTDPIYRNDFDFDEE